MKSKLEKVIQLLNEAKKEFDKNVDSSTLMDALESEDLPLLANEVFKDLIDEIGIVEDYLEKRENEDDLDYEDYE